MKSIFKIAACLSFLALLVNACKLEDIDTQMTEEEAVAAIKLDCDALESYTIQAKRPQAVSFTVTSTTPWTVTVSEGADWLTVTPASSAVSSLSEDIRITAAANDGLVDRSATVTVKGENTSKSYSIAITQLRLGRLSVTPLTAEFALNGSSQSFSLETNLPWEAYAEDDWLTLSPASGESDGSMKSFTVQATAAANTSVVRSTKVVVTSGDERKEFSVTQKGQSLEFLPLDDPSIDRQGGELTLTVNATMDWTVECDNDDFTVTKQGADQVKVAAGRNNRFAPRTAKITLLPASDGFGDVSYSVTVSQDINFKFEGNCEILADGSVKLSSGAVSRVVLLDQGRYLHLTLTMGEKNFGSAAQLWVQGKIGNVNIYNQLSLGGNTRIRTDGNMADPSATSAYKSTTYSITQDELNAMETYDYGFAPNATDPTKMDMFFKVNGSVKASHTGNNPFYYDTGSSSYYFGFYGSTSDGTWYVVKTCDIELTTE